MEEEKPRTKAVTKKGMGKANNAPRQDVNDVTASRRNTRVSTDATQAVLPSENVATSTHLEETESTPSPSTPEEDRNVIRILGCVNHFECLNLPVQSLAPQAVKRAYRDIARLVHPDKCKDPRAEEAFKRIFTAHQCLGDVKRQGVYLEKVQTGTLVDDDNAVEEPRPQDLADVFEEGFSACVEDMSGQESACGEMKLSKWQKMVKYFTGRDPRNV